MVVLESIVGAATIGSFLGQIIAGPLSRNQSSKIRVPLTDAKKAVISTLETLGTVQEILDRDQQNKFLEDCRKMGTNIDQLLKASNKDMNILTKTRRYRKMVKVARDTHDACLDLASRVQEASLTALMHENNKLENIEAKAEEAAIALMERKVRLSVAMRNYKNIFGHSDHPGSGPQRSFTLILCDTSEAEQLGPGVTPTS